MYLYVQFFLVILLYLALILVFIFPLTLFTISHISLMHLFISLISFTCHLNFIFSLALPAFTFTSSTQFLYLSFTFTSDTCRLATYTYLNCTYLSHVPLILAFCNYCTFDTYFLNSPFTINVLHLPFMLVFHTYFLLLSFILPFLHLLFTLTFYTYLSHLFFTYIFYTHLLHLPFKVTLYTYPLHLPITLTFYTYFLYLPSILTGRMAPTLQSIL